MPKLKENIPVTKGNIPIQEELLNKYSNVEEIFENESINKILRIDNIKELKNIDVSKLKVEDMKKLANQIFKSYHEENCFKNKNNNIIVSKNGINESIQKAYFSRSQREYLYEHLLIYSCLGKIIEDADLVNQVAERKGRSKYNSWNYYLDGIFINGNSYLVEFEVVSLSNGKNNYRIQRLKLI